MNIPFHPLANIFPQMSGPDFEEFVASIKENGQRDCIVLFEGQILDGRNRYNACIKAGIEPRFEELQDGVDPLQFVIDHNLHRRHLTDDQRRMVAARIANLGKGRPDEKNPPHGGISQKQAAEMMSVDARGVEKAKAVVSKGARELQDAVDQNRVSVRTAADLASLPVEQQREIVSGDDPKAIKEAARAVRRGEPANGARSALVPRQEPPERLDYAPTPPWATRALVEKVLPEVDIVDLGSVWEPACGEGHMTSVLEEYTKPVIGTDIFDYGAGDRVPPGWYRVQDFMAEVEDYPVCDWIITDPPLGKLERFCCRAIELAMVGVAMFVRWQWLESISRYENLFRPYPPALVALFAERVPQPGGGKGEACCWVVWLKGVGHPTRLIWIRPDRRAALSKPGDDGRFTAHPVKSDVVQVTGVSSAAKDDENFEFNLNPGERHAARSTAGIADVAAGTTKCIGSIVEGADIATTDVVPSETASDPQADKKETKAERPGSSPLEMGQAKRGDPASDSSASTDTLEIPAALKRGTGRVDDYYPRRDGGNR